MYGSGYTQDIGADRMGSVSRRICPSNFDRNFFSYYNDVSRTKILDPPTERKLFMRYKRHKDIKARDQLLESCLRFVVTLAKRYSRNIDTLKELVSAGNLGLMNALDRYDPERGTRFLSYATYWILLAIRNELYSRPLVAMPLWRRKAVRKLKRAKSRAEAENGEPATVDELSREVDLSPLQLERLKIEHFKFTPIDEYFSALSRSEPADVTAINIQGKDILEDIIGALSVKEQFVLRAYYGLVTDRMSLRQIADVLGITSERVRQIRMDALGRLRRCLEYGLQVKKTQEVFA